jgi:MinD-like ATPase involved in chromosome partitioning or flagellar assembly
VHSISSPGAIPVLTAVNDRHAEAALVHAFESGQLGIAVVKRCVDLADLLAIAATGTVRAVVISHDLRRFDRDALARLSATAVGVVVFVPVNDEGAERRVRQIGATHVLQVNAAAAVVAAAVLDAVSDDPGSARPHSLPESLAGLDDFAGPGEDDLTESEHAGRVIAVWGPTGAPGRTTVAATLAFELAATGEPTMLIDADVYGGAVAQSLGLLDEAPGLAAAARAANNGTLDVPALSGLARALTPELRVLTGISRAERWTELRPSAIEAVLALSRRLVAHTVVDCGFCLEEDEELSFDTAAPRRNGATLAVLSDADVVIAVGAADPVSLQRLVRGLSQLAETVPGAIPVVVVNRVRRSLLAGDPQQEIGAALERYAGVVPTAYVPYDLKAVDGALMAGRSLTEVAAESPARKALEALALGLVGKTAAAPKRRTTLRR